jgi:predicted amidohydrolase YtcJ
MWNDKVLARIGQVSLQLAQAGIFLLLAACSGPAEESNRQAADYVFSNGLVYTVTDQQPHAESIAVRDGLIVFIGKSADVAAFTGEKTEVLDMQGGMLLPGFVSAHEHLIVSDSTPAPAASGSWEPEKIIPASLHKNFAAASASGITTFLNPGLLTPNFSTAEGMFEDYQVTMNLLSELEQQGKLTLRTLVQPVYKNPDADVESFVSRADEFAKSYNTDKLRSFGIKIHSEGIWNSRSSLQLEPYADRPGYAGAAGVDAALMLDIVLAANALGLDVVAHVDGSATVRAMVDAIEASRAAGNLGERNALHHLLWTDPQDLLRIMAGRMTVNITPIFSTDWMGQDGLAYELLGEHRVQQQLATYPAIFRNGNRVSLSSDTPASPLALIGPLFNMEAAMTMQDPANPESKVFPPGREGINLGQAIKAVTAFPAWQLRMEDRIGTLEVGKYADIVVLQRNLFELAAHDIADVKVLATMMGGQFTHRDGI